MHLTIITPLTRPKNLLRIENDIVKLKALKGLVVKWIVVVSPQCEAIDPCMLSSYATYYNYLKPSISGNGERNFALNKCLETAWDNYSSTWVYFLDDDNLIHPDFIKLIGQIAQRANEKIYKGYIFGQDRGDTQLIPRPDRINVNQIDTAMYLLHSSIIDKARWKEDEHVADGLFIQEIYQKNRKHFHVSPTIMAYYNKIRML